MPDFYDDIYEFLDKNEGWSSISIKSQGEIIHKICAHTGLGADQVVIILQSILNEIRSNMLKGNTVNLRGLGSFYIASPKSGTKQHVFAKFKPHKSLLMELNDEK